VITHTFEDVYLMFWTGLNTLKKKLVWNVVIFVIEAVEGT